MKIKHVRSLCRSAMIAALYVALTMLANAFGLASHEIQVRFSEALCILPAFTFDAVPGLFIGCLIANLVTGCIPWDIAGGSIATLLGALGTYLLCKKCKAPWLFPLPTILANTLIVPFVLKYAYGFEGAVPYFMLTVGVGEILSAGVMGVALYYALRPHRNRLFDKTNTTRDSFCKKTKKALRICSFCATEIPDGSESQNDQCPHCGKTLCADNPKETDQTPT